MNFSILKLNEKQLEKMSDIAGDLGLVSIASVVLPFVFDKFNAMAVLLGSLATIIFWLISIWLRR